MSVSIITPVFNTEKYLPKCLESLINQTFTDIEIICINDGSTDSSLSILDEYAKKDSRIVVLSQENQKQGAARNKGLETAQGEYITFVDSDDWVEKDYIEKLYNSAKKYNVNMAAASMTRDKKGKLKKHLILNEKKLFLNPNDIIDAIDNHFETAGKLYKYELIKDLRFIENVYYEDAPYTIRAINRCRSMVTVPDAVYHYVSNPKSTIKKKSKKLLRDKIETALNFINYAEENNIKTKDWEIYRDDFFFWKVKYYKYHRDYYLFGIKIFTINIPYRNNVQIQNGIRKHETENLHYNPSSSN